MVIRSPAQGLRVFFTISLLVKEGAWLSEDMYVLAQGLLPSRGLSSNLPEPLPRLCRAYIRFQAVASMAPLIIEGYL